MSRHQVFKPSYSIRDSRREAISELRAILQGLRSIRVLDGQGRLLPAETFERRAQWLQRCFHPGPGSRQHQGKTPKRVRDLGGIKGRWERRDE